MTPVAIIPGSVLTDTIATYYTVPSGDNKLKYVQLTSMRFCNITSADVLVTVYIVPKNAVAANRYLRFAALKIPANTIGDPSSFFIMDDVLLPGTTIQAGSDTDGVIAISAFGNQYP